jgi:EAL and modified HD-GYP domain-containing signal transduction protein
MFNKVKSWLGSGSGETEPEDNFKSLNEVAPLKSNSHPTQEKNSHEASSFVCREAILDRSQRIAAYEFAMGREVQARMLEQSALIRRVYDDAMLRNLAPLGVMSLLGERFALIRLSVNSLRNPLLKAFSNLNTVIMILPGVIAEPDLDELRADLNFLAEIGIKHGWTIDRPRPELSEFISAADFIEIESTTLDGIQLKILYQQFRAAHSHPKLIASHLQSSDDFNLCFNLGFDYFTGPFVTSRENWYPAKSEINRLRVFEALNLIRTGAEFDVIAECLRIDPILTFKLLRYINSPGIGLQHKVSEIIQALMLMGRDRFYRWLSLLLFDFNQPGYHEFVLNEQALTRARFMELLSGQGKIPADSEHLFMTGLFSLLDVMMGRPLEEVLKQVTLPASVASALKGEPGIMRDTLLLSIAVESTKPDEMAAAASICGLEAPAVTSLMLDAMAWSQQVIAAGK